VNPFNFFRLCRKIGKTAPVSQHQKTKISHEARKPKFSGNRQQKSPPKFSAVGGGGRWKKSTGNRKKKRQTQQQQCQTLAPILAPRHIQTKKHLDQK
jgi:hypothetical protein